MTNKKAALKVISLLMPILFASLFIARASALEIPSEYISKLEMKSDNFRGWGDTGNMIVTNVKHPGFTEIIQVTSTKRIGNFWDVGAKYGNVLIQDVKKGDTMLFTFWARVISTKNESGQGLFRVSINKKGGKWSDKTLAEDISVSREWQQFHLPFKCKEDYTVNQLITAFESGLDAQILQIGRAEMYYYGTKIPFTKIPKTKQSYAGREPDAKWRITADERIKKHRMADFKIKVIDQKDKPVKNAKVHISMKRHAYDFGTACKASQLVESSGENYRTKFLELFNSGTFYNDLKWKPISGDWGKGFNEIQTKQALEWVKRNNIRFRGHVMVWPGWKNLPKYMVKKYKDKANISCNEMKHEILTHIEKVSKLTKGYLMEWDVINEPYSNDDLMALCSNEMMVDWFKAARKHMPDVGLALNDYGQIVSMSDTPHMEHFQKTAKLLINQGAPITVLGLQGHFGAMVPTPDRVYLTLERYAKLGLRMRITEFTLAGDNKEVQADYLRDFYTMYFSHPMTIGIQAWGKLIDDDGKDNHLTKAYRALVLKKWWTDEKLKTGKQGIVEGKGFLGDYRLTVEYNGKTKEVNQVLSKDSKEFVIQLD